MQKKILIDCTIFGLQRHGGVANYVAGFIRFLSNNKYDLHITLLLPSTIIYKPKIDFSNFTIVTDKKNTRVSQYSRIKLEGNFDSVFSPYYRVLKNSTNSRLVCTVHDFSYEKFRWGAPKWIHKFIKKRALKVADEIICISESVKFDLNKYYPNYIDADISVIPHGVDENIFFPEPKQYNNHIYFNSVLFVGLRAGYKRFDLAVLATSRVLDKNLVIVGPPLKKSEIKFLDNILPNRWVFLGHVSDASLRELYSSVHCFIFPSEGEGFGLPVLEAAMCGCFVITSNYGGLIDFVQRGISISPNLQESSQYAEIIQNIAKIDFLPISERKSFSWNYTFNKTLELLTNES